MWRSSSSPCHVDTAEALTGLQDCALDVDICESGHRAAEVEDLRLDGSKDGRVVKERDGEYGCESGISCSLSFVQVSGACWEGVATGQS